MLSRFGLFIRNRRDEEIGYINEEDDVPKHGENKSYPYILIVKSLFYAFIGSAIVSLFFIFFILEPDHHDGPEVFLGEHPLNQTIPNSKQVTLLTATKMGDHYPDQCSHEWTSDQLVGRCFGLKPHSDYSAFKSLQPVENSQHCRQLCCRLGDECKTWQYWIDIKVCKLGGLVRVGTENLKTSNWCDSEPPVVWSGRRIETVNNINVEIGPTLTTQCFGLGPSKKVDGQEKVSMEECSKSCLDATDCKLWQWHEKRGCYFSSNSEAFCDPYAGGFDGGRKKSSK